MAKLAGKLPKGNRDGLSGSGAEQLLLSEPATARLVVAIVDCSRITTDVDTGEDEPTARIQRIEMILDAADADQVRDILERRYRQRTGVTELPGLQIVGPGMAAGIADEDR
ncbi:hypothetical protein AB0I55_29305 [Actinocatenispora sera]|uniref:hypothetical protein n=1 Tax=Actinocatenispora sera TaxID=390989 RepID=UPI0033C041D5